MAYIEQSYLSISSSFFSCLWWKQIEYRVLGFLFLDDLNPKSCYHTTELHTTEHHTTTTHFSHFSIPSSCCPSVPIHFPSQYCSFLLSPLLLLLFLKVFFLIALPNNHLYINVRPYRLFSEKSTMNQLVVEQSEVSPPASWLYELRDWWWLKHGQLLPGTAEWW